MTILKRFMIGYAALLVACGLIHVLGGIAGDVIFLLVSHGALGFSLNQPKFYLALFACAVGLYVGPLLGVNAALYGILQHVYFCLFAGNVINRAASYLESVINVCRVVKPSQARIGRVLLSIGLFGIALSAVFVPPVLLLFAFGACVIAGFNISYISFQNKKTLIAQSLWVGWLWLAVFLAPLLLTKLSFCFVFAGSLLAGAVITVAEYEKHFEWLQRALGLTKDQINSISFENYKSIFLQRYTLLNATVTGPLFHKIKVLILSGDVNNLLLTAQSLVVSDVIAAQTAQQQAVAAQQQAALEVAALQREAERVFVKLVRHGTPKQIKAFLESTECLKEEKEKLFLLIVKSGNIEKLTSLLNHYEWPLALHIKAIQESPYDRVARTILDKRVWLNGDVDKVLGILEDSFPKQFDYWCKTFGLVCVKGEDKNTWEFNSHLNPISGKLHILRYKKLMHQQLAQVVSGGMDKNAALSAREKLKDVKTTRTIQKIDNTGLVSTVLLKDEFERRGRIPGVEKEIKGMLLDTLDANLQVNTTEPHAAEIRECIRTRREGLVNGVEADLAVLRGFIGANYTVHSMIAWRLYDPNAPRLMDDYPAGTSEKWPSLLVPPKTLTGTFFQTVESAPTHINALQGSNTIRENVAYLYMWAKAADKLDLFISFLASAGRANNYVAEEREDNLTEKDNPSCYPGFFPRFGLLMRALEPGVEETLRRIVHDKVQNALEQKFKDNTLTRTQKKDWYDAVMLLHSVTIPELLSQDFYLPSDVEQAAKVKDSGADLKAVMQLRTVLQIELFGATIESQKTILTSLLEAEVDLTGKNIDAALDYHGMSLLDENRLRQMGELFAQYMVEAPAAVVSVATPLDNPFVLQTWEQYQANNRLSSLPNSQSEQARQKSIESQFMVNALCHHLFKARKEKGLESTQDEIKDMVFDFRDKARDQNRWMIAQLESLQAALLLEQTPDVSNSPSPLILSSNLNSNSGRQQVQDLRSQPVSGASASSNI